MRLPFLYTGLLGHFVFYVVYVGLVFSINWEYSFTHQSKKNTIFSLIFNFFGLYEEYAKKALTAVCPIYHVIYLHCQLFNSNKSQFKTNPFWEYSLRKWKYSLTKNSGSKYSLHEKIIWSPAYVKNFCTLLVKSCKKYNFFTTIMIYSNIFRLCLFLLF